MQTIVHVDNLKIIRGKFSLQIPDLRLSSGKILGIAGPNGSGKTTLLEALTGMIAPSSGSIWIAGLPLDRNLRQTKAVLGYIPDDDSWFIAELTAREYIRLLAKVYSAAGKKIENSYVIHMAQKLRFTSWDQRLDTLSHGNKKKVQLIAGLMHRPSLIIVDELRNGLDPLAIIAAEQLIRAEAERGAAIIAATHDLWWAERVADEIVLLDSGKKVLQAPTKLLTSRYGSLEKLFLQVAGG